MKRMGKEMKMIMQEVRFKGNINGFVEEITDHGDVDSAAFLGALGTRPENFVEANGPTYVSTVLMVKG